MLSHTNLLANVYQVLAPDAGGFTSDDVMFCFLPLYHIYGLNVALNTILIAGGTLVLMPRFNVQQIGALALEEGFHDWPCCATCVEYAGAKRRKRRVSARSSHSLGQVRCSSAASGCGSPLLRSNWHYRQSRLWA